MRRRIIMAIGLGAVVGTILAISALAMLGSRVIAGGVDAVLIDSTIGEARSIFIVTKGAMNAFILVAGLLGGAVLGVIGYVVGREADPSAERISVTAVSIMSAVVGAMVAFGAARSLIGVGGLIEGDTVTLSVFRTIVVTIVTGAVTGALVGLTAERVSRADALGLEGVAWPRSALAFAADLGRAMGLPLLAIVVGIGLVVPFSQLILSAPHALALALFAGASAVVLAVAAFVASRPPRRQG